MALPGLMMPPGLMTTGYVLKDQWTVAADMPGTRVVLAAAPLSDGRVLVCGGSDGSSFYRTTWIYNPTTNSWSSVANMPGTREGHTAVPLSDGRVLVCGGFDGTRHNTTWIYNPSTNSWSSVANMPAARHFHAAAPLSDGRVLVCGGRDSSSFYKTTWIYG